MSVFILNALLSPEKWEPVFGQGEAQKTGSGRMEGDYNFWKDFFDTYQSLSDWMKFAWLAILPTFALGLIALILRYRLMFKRAIDTDAGTLAYTVKSDENGFLRIYPHDGADTLAARTSEPHLLPLPGTTHPAHGKHPPPDV